MTQQEILHQRQSRRRIDVRLLLLFPGVRRVVGRKHIDTILGDRADDRRAIAGFLDRRVALDQVAEPRVVGAREMQEVDAGLGGDPLHLSVRIHQRAGFEQLELLGGADVQHV